MDREMTLVADAGMRILTKMETECPYYLAANDELWKAWKEIQKCGGGSSDNWFRKGWKIRTRHLPNGSVVMTLEIRLDSCLSDEKTW